MSAADAGTVTLGDLTVNRLGFGAMRITGDGIWGEPRDRDECRRVLRRAVDLGVNFIDTADSYGPDVSEQLIAEELHPYPEDLVIATKGGFIRHGPGSWHADCHPERLKQCCEGSLRRLKLDRIDVYQLHTVDRNVPFADSVGALKELRDEGKIRHVGLSNVNARQLAEAQGIVHVVSVQDRYSASDRTSEEVLEACERGGLAFIPWFPLGAGRATEPGGPLDRAAQDKGITLAQAALAWLLDRSEVMLPIPGTSSVDHLEENVAAAEVKGLRL